MEDNIINQSNKIVIFIFLYFGNLRFKEILWLLLLNLFFFNKSKKIRIYRAKKGDDRDVFLMEDSL